MPFHAFLSVWAGSVFGHQALIQSWKEVLTLILTALAAALIIKHPARLQRFRNSLFYAIGAFAVVSAVVTLIARPNLTAAAFGVKTDIEFLLLFWIAFLVADKQLSARLTKIVLATGALVAVIGLLLSFVLAPDFLKIFGYGPNTILPFRLIGPQSFGIRTPSTLGGPNQFGAFLILPLCLSVALMIKRWRWWRLPLTLILLGGIGASYSRSAWLGAAVGILMILLSQVKTKRVLLAVCITIAALASAATFFSYHAITNSDLSYYLLHQSTNVEFSSNSTTQHSTAFAAAITSLAANPWGSGLGSAGPASFHGGPANIPESFYLQLALETGVIGVIAFLGIICILGWQLFNYRHQSITALALFGALVGLSVENLFLHGWADSSTAFVFWIVAGVYLGTHRKGTDDVA